MRAACWNAFAGSGQVHVLCAGIDVMCALLRFPDPLHSLRRLVEVMVDHSYPRVRQHACLQLQLLISSNESLCPNDETRDRLVFILIGGAKSEASVALQAKAVLGFAGGKEASSDDEI